MEVTDIIETCGGCPSSWTARTIKDNRPVYIRFRWGCLSITVGDPEDSDVDDNSNIVYDEQISDGMDGIISWNKVEKILNKIEDLD